MLNVTLFFFFNDTATTEIYTLSLHDALPIYGRQAGLGRELFVGGEARAIIPELGQDLRRVDSAAAGQALHERAIGMLSQRGGNGGGELLEVRHERAEDSDEGAHHVAAGVGFRRADLARRRPAKAGEQLGHWAAP